MSIWSEGSLPLDSLLSKPVDELGFIMEKCDKIQKERDRELQKARQKRR